MEKKMRNLIRPLLYTVIPLACLGIGYLEGEYNASPSYITVGRTDSSYQVRVFNGEGKEMKIEIFNKDGTHEATSPSERDTLDTLECLNKDWI